MAGLTAQGQRVKGKRYRAAGVSLGEVFGISGAREQAGATKVMRMLMPEELAHTLAGRRIDGTAIQLPSQKRPDRMTKKELAIVAGAQKRLRTALGLPADGDPTQEHLQNIAARKMGNGERLDLDAYRRAITGEGARIGFVDLTFSASKAVSVAWAMAKTPEEQALYVGIVERASDAAMTFMAAELGKARMRSGGETRFEQAEAPWLSYTHFTSRPAVETVLTDAEGHGYTAFHEVPGQRADPQIHVHNPLLNHLLQRDGRISAVDLNRLQGLLLVGGAVFQAYTARYLREAGHTVTRGEHGDAQIVGVDKALQRQFSKRHEQAEAAARELAAKQGKDWETLKRDGQQIEFLARTTAEYRRDKVETALASPAAWQAEAVAAGFTLPERLRRVPKPELTPERRIEVAFEAMQEPIARLFTAKSVVTGDEIRLIAARALLTAGISDTPTADIDALTRRLRERGIHHPSLNAELEWQPVLQHGKERMLVTTDVTRMTEEAVIAATRRLAADRSAAIPSDAIDRAAEAYLRRHPEIDGSKPHWQEQVEWARQLGAGGRLAIGVGVAGAGKSTALEVLADAARAQGREVFGTALSWTATAEQGYVPEDRRAALDRFLRVAETEGQRKYVLNEKTTLIVDEVGLLGNAQMRRVLRLAEKTGMAVSLVGDPAQCRSPGEGGDPIELIAAAIPGAIPELTRSIRQKTAHAIAVTAAFRDDPAKGLAMKIEDGSAVLVPGGETAMQAHAVAARREKLEANAHDPSYTLVMQTGSNLTASAISRAIRADRQARGEIGADQVEIDAMDYTGAHRMKVAPGDEVRVFSRIQAGRQVIANNSDVIVVRQTADVQGMDVRNPRTGVEGRITWDKLQRERGGPMWATYGGCGTIDAMQAKTASFTIEILDQRLSRNKLYAAESRNRFGSMILVDEAVVRRGLVAKAVLTDEQPRLTRDAIWQAVSESVSTPDIRLNATTTLRGRADHDTAPRAPHMQRAGQERQHLTAYARDRLMAVAQHVMQIAERAVDRVRLRDRQVERKQHTHRRRLRM